VVVMIVVAMFVVVMVITVVIVIMMTVAMIMIVVMTMIVRRMIVPGMPVRGFRRMCMAGIGAAFGIERRLDLDDARAQALHHRLDDVIPADAQPFWHDLRRQMTIAEMPGDPHEMERINPADFDQRLGSSNHLDQPAVFQYQRITAAQRDRVFQVEQEFEPARARHRHPPPVPIVEIEHDGIGCGLCPAMLTPDFRGADHRVRISPPWRR
jgi:hypothetical protein